MGKIFTEYEQGKYDSADFDVRCPHCNHQEPWSQLRMTGIGCIITFLGILSWIGAFFTPARHDSVPTVLFLVGLAIFIGNGIASSMRKKRIYARIANLSPESLPKIYLDTNFK